MFEELVEEEGEFCLLFATVLVTDSPDFRVGDRGLAVPLLLLLEAALEAAFNDTVNTFDEAEDAAEAEAPVVEDVCGGGARCLGAGCGWIASNRFRCVELAELALCSGCDDRYTGSVHRPVSDSPSETA